MNVSFLGTLLATLTAILSLAWRSNLLPPKVLGGVIVVAILAFWISLLAETPSCTNDRTRRRPQEHGDVTSAPGLRASGAAARGWVEGGDGLALLFDSRLESDTVRYSREAELIVLPAPNTVGRTDELRALCLPDE